MQSLYICNQYHGPSSLLLGPTLVAAGVTYLVRGRDARLMQIGLSRCGMAHR